MLKAFYHKTVDDVLPGGKQWRILHACTGILFCPPDLLRLLTAAFPEQLAEHDEDGNLPMHVAASSSVEEVWNYNHAVDQLTEHEKNFYDSLSRCPKSTIEILLEAQPDAAELRNRDGRLPFQLAMESNKAWGDGTDALFKAFPRASQIRDSNGKLPIQLAIEKGWAWNDGISVICEAFPHAVNVKDNETGLYPFMLAASIAEPSLSTIYSLLRKIPELLGRFAAAESGLSPAKCDKLC